MDITLTNLFMSETNRYRHLVLPYIGSALNVIDIGSQGWPVVPHAIQVELPPKEFAHYTGGKVLDGPAWRGDGSQLPFKDGVVDVCYSSHLLEDFPDWRPVVAEWWRVVKPHGYLIILTPDNDLWEAAVRGGQCPNCSHRHCGKAGELTSVLLSIDPRAHILEDHLTQCHPGDYSILFVARKRP